MSLWNKCGCLFCVIEVTWCTHRGRSRRSVMRLQILNCRASKDQQQLSGSPYIARVIDARVRLMLRHAILFPSSPFIHERSPVTWLPKSHLRSATMMSNNPEVSLTVTQLRTAALECLDAYVPDGEKDKTLPLLKALIEHAPNDRGRRAVCIDVLESQDRATGKINSLILRGIAERYRTGLIIPSASRSGVHKNLSSI